MRPGCAGARGVALVAVLWIVAALTILVTGVVQTQRQEVQVASAERTLLKGTAIGQAALNLVLQRMAGGALRVERLVRVPIQYEGADVQVEVMPLGGLVDLRRAPLDLLTVTFEQVGLLPAEQARGLAEQIVAARSDTARRVGPKLEVPEDLLTFAQADYDLYARIAPFVTCDGQSSGRINPLAAPAEVLNLLAPGNPQLAQAFASQRDAGVPAIDTTRFEVAFVDLSSGSRFRMTAIVSMPDQQTVTLARNVDVSPDQTSAWRILQSSSRVARAPGTPASQ